MIHFRAIAILFIVVFYNSADSQTVVRTARGGYMDSHAMHPNHSPEAYDEVQDKIQDFIATHQLSHLANKESVEFDLPIKGSNNTFVNNSDYDYAVSKYFDHNSASNVYGDFSCGSLTYDGHLGTDYYSWPFTWYQYEEDLFDVVAVADGYIVAIVDGEGVSCDFSGHEQEFGNYIVIAHSNEYQTQYSHLKAGSLADLNDGDFVRKGDFLAKVGTSGNSNGPHLHFHPFHSFQEDRQDSDIFDPYQDSECQRENTIPKMKRSGAEEYEYTQIISVTSHFDMPVWKESCQDTKREDPKFSSEFKIGEEASFVTAVRDMKPGQMIVSDLRDPNNNIKNSWDVPLSDLTGGNGNIHQSSVFSVESYHFSQGDVEGEWILSSYIYDNNGPVRDINGIPLVQRKIITLRGLVDNNEFEKEGFSVSPNPCSDRISVFLNSELLKIKGDLELSLIEVSGRMINNLEYQKTINGFNIDISNKTKGVYFLILRDRSSNKKFYQKLIKG